MGYQTWRQGPFLPQAMKCQKEVSRYFLIIEPKHIQICVSGEGVWLQRGRGLPCLAPVVQVHTPASRRPTLASPSRRSTRWSARGVFFFQDFTRLSLVLFREEPIPEEKRESCSNTELGPEVKITIQSIPDVSGLTFATCRWRTIAQSSCDTRPTWQAVESERL